jgi:hypothetical protein
MKLGVQSIAEICNNSIPIIRKELPYSGHRSVIEHKWPGKESDESYIESCSIEDISAPRQELSEQITSDNSEELL